MAILTIKNSSCVIPPIKYGLLYSWYAATDVREISSSDDWVFPSSNQWVVLRDYLGGATVAGGKLKDTNTTYWDAPNTGATNEVGFYWKGTGRRDDDGVFLALKTISVHSSSSSQDEVRAYGYSVNSENSSLQFGTVRKKDGNFIRLLKTTTTLSHGETGVYMGNDGKIYPTICIGTQEWVASNLAETEYRNGDSIPEVTDNTAWAALTTGALCAFDNDWSYV